MRGRCRRPSACRRGSYGTAVSSPFVFEQVRQELDAKLPPKLAARGGFQVYSTVDQRLQFAARRAIKDVLKSPGDPQAALVAINVHNGNVLALGTSDYFSATNQFNLATVGHRSPGSTFKLFALVDALRRGADPSKVYYPSGYVSFPEDDPVCPQAGGWSPDNAESGFGGYLSLETATIHSVNVVYAQLMHDLGPAQVAATAHLLGIRSKLPLHCSMVLGADDVTPLELTSAYATIAAGGVYHPPRVIRRVQNVKGKIVADNAFKVHSKRVVSEGIAAETTSILKQVMTEGTGTHARLDDDRPEAGKTGTAENYGNAWFCGYTPDIAVVRVGRLPRLEQATGRHRGCRRGLRRHAAGGDLEGLHDDRHAAAAAARFPGAQDAHGLPRVQGDDLVRLQPEAARAAGRACGQAEAEAEADGPAAAAGTRRDRPAEPLAHQGVTTGPVGTVTVVGESPGPSGPTRCPTR